MTEKPVTALQELYEKDRPPSNDAADYYCQNDQKRVVADPETSKQRKKRITNIPNRMWFFHGSDVA